ncbi:HI1506-related protein [Achromobacter denitrificans]
MAIAKPRGRQATAKTAIVKPDGAKALKVIPKIDGFRRAGRAFAGETVIPLSELTDEQFEQLTTEPQLVTILIDLPGAQEQSETAA